MQWRWKDAEFSSFFPRGLLSTSTAPCTVQYYELCTQYGTVIPKETIENIHSTFSSVQLYNVLYKLQLFPREILSTSTAPLTVYNTVLCTLYGTFFSRGTVEYIHSTNCTIIWCTLCAMQNSSSLEEYWVYSQHLELCTIV